MFRRLRDIGGSPVPFTFDGNALSGRQGDTVAAALLGNAIEACRTSVVSGSPRAPYCMMGVCFECLVTIDGVGNRQGCLVLLAEGMRIETQRGARLMSTEDGTER